ncbi:nuclease domain-containing protein [Marinobacter sp. JSM 1782161]|uniref:nuclease domain-containing protein n=1 Tax=Marinobacter sp. JSM 1782161 TaxID=2685906 RepID=UPI001A9DAAC8|nr:nuclease domain-containing protein [Marinobacter sp. JSM 1782161]
MKRTPLKRKTPLKAKAPMKRSSMKRTSKPKMTPIRRSARGAQCMVGVPHICNGNPETVVLAHLNGGGMGRKREDWQAAYACSACHEFLDGGYVRYGVTRDERDLLHLNAVLRTQAILVEKGFIEVKGAA